ncbi:MAG: hypothetical protein JWM53_1168, partial [bacterium]|nr:hypothetical protein [bacterium]
VLLVAAPAVAQEGARTDLATVRTLVAQAAQLIKREDPIDLARAIAQVNLSVEVQTALRTRPAAGLKVAPR